MLWHILLWHIWRTCVDDRKVVAERERCDDSRGCADVGVRAFHGIYGISCMIGYMVCHVLWHIWYFMYHGIYSILCVDDRMVVAERER
jgi:hypothetical protein